MILSIECDTEEIFQIVLNGWNKVEMLSRPGKVFSISEVCRKPIEQSKLEDTFLKPNTINTIDGK